MGQIVFSSRNDATGDAAHRPRVATHAKWQGVPPEAALPRPVGVVARLSVRIHIARHRAPSHGPRERGQTDPIRSENA